ncbi:hypothetical protein B0J12DRAFT_138707 [Macrophomina phaseolina]|uniref:Uncharacterized protein n=1 Tax=Macrophomina phaseolina TaxID=35725 RepID=A0ABQ8G7K4_9PEZI|nr:hypothetical protein B0J12DRAFT_138707 [Macrophomina phaseolina]
MTQSGNCPSLSLTSPSPSPSPSPHPLHPGILSSPHTRAPHDARADSPTPSHRPPPRSSSTHTAQGTSAASRPNRSRHPSPRGGTSTAHSTNRPPATLDTDAPSHQPHLTPHARTPAAPEKQKKGKKTRRLTAMPPARSPVVLRDIVLAPAPRARLVAPPLRRRAAPMMPGRGVAAVQAQPRERRLHEELLLDGFAAAAREGEAQQRFAQHFWAGGRDRVGQGL